MLQFFIKIAEVDRAIELLLHLLDLFALLANDCNMRAEIVLEMLPQPPFENMHCAHLASQILALFHVFVQVFLLAFKAAVGTLHSHFLTSIQQMHLVQIKRFALKLIAVLAVDFSERTLLLMNGLLLSWEISSAPLMSAWDLFLRAKRVQMIFKFRR